MSGAWPLHTLQASARRFVSGITKEALASEAPELFALRKRVAEQPKIAAQYAEPLSDHYRAFQP